MAESKDAAQVPQHDNVEVGKAKAVKDADKKSGPDIHDAELNDSPLRSGSPQEPMTPTLTEGAGQHMPNKDPHFGADGRWYADVADARKASEGYMSEDDRVRVYGKAK
jgi:hypothetical protein